MTEQEWLACAHPKPMLDFLRGKASERKMRLFACACCRRIWGLLLLDERTRKAVEVSERFADGQAGKKELRLAALGAKAATEELAGAVTPALKARSSAASATFFVTFRRDCAHYTTPIAASANYFHLGSEMVTEQAAQASLLRCITDNPFRPVSIEAVWLTPTVTNLAATAYGERILPSGELDAARLGVLADALEETGCTESAILDHLRAPGPHVRGCWPLDLILGRD
jgi:hypothetical protein